MTSSGKNNVVPLSQARKRSVETDMKELLSRLPEPVVRVRTLSEKSFTSAIQNMFDCVDDALFELADRTQSNLEQNVFFESMREIRIHRRTMEKVFIEGISQQFASLLNPASSNNSESEDPELFKLFERHVISQLSTVLSHVNNELTDLGVAVPTPSKSTRNPQPPATQYAAPADNFSLQKQIKINLLLATMVFKKRHMH